MIPADTNRHCPYCGGHQVVNMIHHPAHPSSLKACRSCGRAWLSHCPTCGSDDVHALTVERFSSPHGLPLGKTTAWKCSECGEDWTDDEKEDPRLVYVTVVGVYRDLARMSGDLLGEAFCVLGTGPDTEAAIKDALQRELRGGDFDIADLEVIAVFGGWRERFNPSSASAILQQLEEAAQEEEEEEG